MKVNKLESKPLFALELIGHNNPCSSEGGNVFNSLREVERFKPLSLQQ